MSGSQYVGTKKIMGMNHEVNSPIKSVTDDDGGNIG